ncbi:Predicted arabinose efflux permease, MFS family [Reichenbachiella faecimaris]|uniref:Predicted arabinose efflux permease, MFS family n=1 Tax=Reichenbachiella faecimaris TaxID=692418 RepID=A0A1W2GDV5_REIFA|nr:MFS transporter [Reichenbachiella faecimaris]SMD34781.1 Predicted arabinose efflux permease, MFS family [Reichenbachiella faecimaris]
MIRRQLNAYIQSYQGLSREIWLLALITLINRAGTMVVPFLSLYLTASLGYSLSEVGWVMTAFGTGSILGAWLGGKLTDHFGYYKIMLFSLIGSGVVFIIVQYLNEFWFLVGGIFILMLIADMFRPAMYVSIRAYSKPENNTRSVTLIRLAINLGFSFGPAMGGIIIATMTYGSLFWIDGITCLVASILLYLLLNEKDGKPVNEQMATGQKRQSAYSDLPYLVFLAIVFLTAIVFLQMFATVPIYYKTIHHLSEGQIGLLLGMNGMLIFLFEMPLINWLEKSRISKASVLLIGTLVLGMGFWVFNLSEWAGILIVSMFFITLGEMLIFPFANSFAMERSEKGKAGEYMALFPIAFSAAHIIGPNIGMQLIETHGYNFTWSMILVATAVGLGLCLYLKYRLNAEAHGNTNKKISSAVS